MNLPYLITSYNSKKAEIEKRLQDFKEVSRKSEQDIFAELVFCILTPQSKAHSCDKAVKELFASRAVFGKAGEIRKRLKTLVRFHNTKARHIIRARDLFLNNGGIKKHLKGDPAELREWLVKNVYGLGYKEASHFLRNVGIGENLAILDRHILKNLVMYGVIKEIPKSLTRKRYLEIEKSVNEFGDAIGIPASHLDLLFWSHETGEIFK